MDAGVEVPDVLPYIRHNPENQSNEEDHNPVDDGVEVIHADSLVHARILARMC